MAGYFKVNAVAPMTVEICPLSDKAFRLWITAGCWCTQYSKFWVPVNALRMLGGTKRAAAELADAGLWLADEVAAKQGWWFVENHLWEASSGVTREPVPTWLRRAVLARDGNACLRCGTDSDLQMDHVFPWSKGGATNYENLQTLCGRCNRAKGAKV